MTGLKASTATDTAAVKAGFREYLFPCAPPYYADPLVLVEGQGARVIDSEGDEFLDFFSGILTTALGHCHPEVVERVREQLGTLGHISTLYLGENQVEMAKRLAAIAPGRLLRIGSNPVAGHLAHGASSGVPRYHDRGDPGGEPGHW